MAFTIINGLMLGIEHTTGDEEDEFEYVIVVNILIFSIAWVKWKDGYE